MGVGRWVTAVALFAASSALDHLTTPSFWTGLLDRLALGAGLVALLWASVSTLSSRAGLLMQQAASERPAVDTAQATSYLDTVVGSAVVRSMPPGDVLTELLKRVYPEETNFKELVTWILGGPGRDPDCGDIVVSHDTRVHYRVEPVSETHCLSYLTCRYRYSGAQDNHLLVIFATSSLQVAKLLASERVYPLYELWILEEGVLDEFIPSQQATVQVGMSYAYNGGAGVVEPTPLTGKEVDYRSYDRYLRIPPNVDRNEIRMFVLDLQDLVDDHLIETIDEITLHSSNVANTDRGYLVWWPPHPCYVDEVSFDLTHLRGDNVERELIYQVVTSSIGSAGMQVRDWTPLSDTISVPVKAWMLPGHNVTLVYRPRYESGVPDDHVGSGDR